MFSKSTKLKESVMKTAFSIVGAFALIPFLQATALAGRPTQLTSPAPPSTTTTPLVANPGANCDTADAHLCFGPRQRQQSVHRVIAVREL